MTKKEAIVKTFDAVSELDAQEPEEVLVYMERHPATRIVLDMTWFEMLSIMTVRDTLQMAIELKK